jgi:ABC-type enterobactin transport system permease subunit
LWEILRAVEAFALIGVALAEIAGFAAGSGAFAAMAGPQMALIEATVITNDSILLFIVLSP